MTTLSLVIPCYNEREGVPSLIQRLEETRRALEPGVQLECVFVDDGSRDGTAEALEAACRGRVSSRVLRHVRNRGLGAALRTGLSAVTGDLVATADSDCTYDPLELVPMVALLVQGADVVIGSAYHPRGAV